MCVRGRFFFGIALLALTIAAGQAYAGMTFHNTIDRSNPGLVINTLTVDSDTDLTAVAAKSTLVSGFLNQLPLFPGADPNDPGLWGQPGASGLDSYISINGAAPSSHSGGSILCVGCGPPQIFDNTGIDLAWGNTVGGDIGTGMHVATLVFSDDANGGFEMYGANAGLGPGDPAFVAPFVGIQGGAIVVPEPGAIGLLGLGAVALLRRRG